MLPMFRDRALAVALIALLVVGVLTYLQQRGPSGMPWFAGCLFHRLTGLDCPGCGMTRATHAVLNGRFSEAFRFNPLGMILLPIGVVGGLALLPAWLRGKPMPGMVKALSRAAWPLLGLIVLYGVLRNLPIWPFTLLAPP